MLKRTVPAVVFGIALAAAGVAAAAAVTQQSPRSLAASSATAGRVTLHKTTLGKVLATSTGKTLYLFLKDKNGRSSCYSACAGYWPPLMKKGTLRAGTGVKAKLLGTTMRKNGKRQVTYNHHPLYLFSGDTGPGQVSGQGLNNFGAKWYVVSAAGRAIKASPPSGGGTTGTSTYTIPTYP